MADKATTREHVAQLVRQCLEEGKTVIIDGLGVFRPHGKRGYRFVAHRSPKVFVAYVQEDAAAVDRLCDQLEESGFDAWVDRRKLMPGQNWPRGFQCIVAIIQRELRNRSRAL